MNSLSPAYWNSRPTPPAPLPARWSFAFDHCKLPERTPACGKRNAGDKFSVATPRHVTLTFGYSTFQSVQNQPASVARSMWPTLVTLASSNSGKAAEQKPMQPSNQRLQTL